MNSSNPPSSISAPSVTWRKARRFLLATAAIVTLIALFYTVENWRGKRAWDKCRRELESKGEIVDWAAFIPPPVPDDKNFFKAPGMQEWFVKDSARTAALRATKTGSVPLVMAPPPRFTIPQLKDRKGVLLAEIKLAAPGIPIDSAATNVVLRFGDPAARQKVAELLTAAVGPCAIGAQACLLVAKPLDQFEPRALVLQADRVATAKELAAFLPRNPITNSTLAWSTTSYLRVEPTPSNSFRVVLAEPVYGAADYLAWNEPLNEDFARVRKALERPYARMDGNYEQPYAVPLVNFVEIRAVAQILSQRAQSHLLLGHSQAAGQELALIRELCGILGSKPPGKPVTLVAAMIEVAVTGLYTTIVEDGLRLHAWGEPELIAIERQLQEADLLEPVVKAFKAERAGTSRTFEITEPGELVKLFKRGFSEAVVLRCMPRGWFYQNIAFGAALQQDWLGCVDPTNHLVLPQQAASILQKLRPASPYTFLTAAALPNFIKAVQTTARNQTLVDQARVACALERFRLAEGQYPASLEVLVPRFIEKLPHDLIGGQPLKYRPTDNGDYLLYSLGWDEKDYGGEVGRSRDEGDWVWARAK